MKLALFHKNSTYNCLIHVSNIHGHGRNLSTIKLPGGGRHICQHSGVVGINHRRSVHEKQQKNCLLYTTNITQIFVKF